MRHHFFVKPSPPYAEPVRRALRVLSAAEEERVKKNRVAVHEHLPELVPFIKELHEAGMIDGWRGVAGVVVHASTLRQAQGERICNVDQIDISARHVDKTKGNEHGFA